jgi:hypothetical protein
MEHHHTKVKFTCSGFLADTYWGVVPYTNCCGNLTNISDEDSKAKTPNMKRSYR